MAKALNPDQKRQKYLILVFIIIVLITIFLLRQEIFKKVRIPTFIEELKVKKVEIDFRVLENPILKELQPFEEIKPFEEKTGRETPFLPY